MTPQTRRPRMARRRYAGRIARLVAFELAHASAWVALWVAAFLWVIAL
jgi:hypothetical protein